LSSQVLIIGGGRGGQALVKIFTSEKHVNIVGVVDKSLKAPGMLLAAKLNIPIAKDYHVFLAQANVVINVTGDESLTEKLRAEVKQGQEIIGGQSAKLFWHLVTERQKSIEEAQKQLEEYQALYEVGLTLASSENLSTVNQTIVEYATRLTKTPAGSLAILDESHGEMVLSAVKGFSKNFAKVTHWQIRAGGLTNYILNQAGPVVISNLDKFKGFDNPVLVAEKVKALLAVPLKAEGKIAGVLYVNDFVPREFSQREISILALLSTYAALAIERTKLLENTQLLAITDGLTGLYNHRHFQYRLNEELARAQRYKHTVSLMFIDVDYFKEYNDINGHMKGNNVLRTIGYLIRANQRQSDFAARWGGEEFAVIMPETAKEQALNLAERLRVKVEKTPFENEEKQPLGKITISLGVASFPADGLTSDELCLAADKALYKAKSAGRNCAVAC